MSFQFCCPQGHLLQGDPSQVGQLFQCPICGGNFLVPPPEMSPLPETSQAPAGDFLLGPLELGFDPHEKDSLPFEILGESGAPTTPFPASRLTPSSFPVPSFPVPSFPAPSFPGDAPPEASFFALPLPAAFLPAAGLQDFLQSVPASTDNASPWQDPPKILHIRCPSGHLVKARSDLLGKNGRCPACKKTFELRYEDSVEFQRRKEKILEREEVKTGKAWMAWAFLALFLVIVGLIVLMYLLSR